MDTAFKLDRWNFEYLGIDDGQDGMEYCEVTLGRNEYKTTIEWNELRKAINKLLTSYNLNEDKLMGPFFFIAKTAQRRQPQIDQVNLLRFLRVRLLCIFLRCCEAEEK